MKILIVFSVILSLQVKGQDKNTIIIAGKVIDEKTKDSLPGATIIYQNKYIGTTSNLNGNFTLTLNNARESDSIFVSFMGYETIKTTISECLKIKRYKLKSFVTKLNEVTVVSKKQNIKKFIKEVITSYNKNKRKNPHIAIAHYREKAEKNNQLIMFMESVGYSVFLGKQANAAPLSNYKFFCENTKCYVTNPKWVKYKENTGGNNIQNVAPSGSANLNIFRYLELEGLLSNKYYKKYNYKKDSTYYIQNKLVYCIRFDGSIAKGVLHVFADTKQLLKIECSTTGYWSSAFFKRVNAHVEIQFHYYENVPFISKITAFYQHKKLQYQNNLDILVQKFNDFKLTEEQYWSLNNFDNNPYIEYNPKYWKTIGIETNNSKVYPNLDSIFLEKQFKNFSNRWFFTNKERSNLAVLKIKELKQNF